MNSQALLFLSRLKTTSLSLGFAAILFGTPLAQATTVQFQTVLGDFEVNLYDKTTPKTVANFLAYVQANAYSNVIIHRSIKDFVVQGGGYKYAGSLPPTAIPAIKDAQGKIIKVENEPIYSNVRGTIAMAKVGEDPDSATNQWFFNVADNSGSLDKTAGGFTVFGQVTGNGMAIVDALVTIDRFNMGGAFTTIPLRNYTATDATNNVTVTENHLITLNNIVVLDASPDTADGISPTPNTLLNQNKDSGGALDILSLLVLGLLALVFKSRFNGTRINF